MYSDSLNMLSVRGRSTATSGALCTKLRQFTGRESKKYGSFIGLSSSNNNTMASKTVVAEV